VTEIWATLAAGATVVLATQEEAGDGDRLKRIIEDHAVTMLQATPATWRLLKQSGWTPQARFKGLIGGEAVPIDLVNHYVPRLGSLWNMYGPTEATVWASCCRLEADGRIPPIGKPLPGYRFHVLGDDGQPVAAATH
jgi:non-ribosomal peptide synthetase component F